MKVLLINGSPKENGTTYTALSEVAEVLKNEEIETEIIHLGKGIVRDCIGCGGCAGKGKCVFSDDKVNEIIEKAEKADGIVVGTPVYYAHSNGRVLSSLNRMFYAGKSAFTHKVAAAVAVARRGGTTSAIDEINKHFMFNQMPIASSTYWNIAYGSNAEDVKKDEEGMQTMRNLGRNIAWLLKCIKSGEENGISKPVSETGNRTNFIR